VDISGNEWTIAFGVLGIVVSIYVGLKARNVMRRRQSQKQVAKGSSTAIQSGRDTHIGKE
jgi:hypothetical protein